MLARRLAREQKPEQGLEHKAFVVHTTLLPLREEVEERMLLRVAESVSTDEASLQRCCWRMHSYSLALLEHWEQARRVAVIAAGAAGAAVVVALLAAVVAVAARAPSPSSLAPVAFGSCSCSSQVESAVVETIAATVHADSDLATQMLPNAGPGRVHYFGGCLAAGRLDFAACLDLAGA